MPVEFGVWRIDGGLAGIPVSKLEDETPLEDILAKDIGILGLDVFVIGRQVPTAFGKKIDLLAMNVEGDLVVIELKRDRTPRDVVAQVLDYGSWVKGLTYDDIVGIYSSYDPLKKFEQAFDDRYGVSAPESLNQSHELVIVASDLDGSTERILAYLSADFGVPINVVYFRYFQDDARKYLIRAWLIPPDTPEQAGSKKPGKQETWNGQDFYVTLSQGPHRNWEDCVKYGFVSAGGGKRWSQPLQNLFVGARVFAHIPDRGYVGIGIVQQTSQRVADFKVQIEDKFLPILDAPLSATKMGENADDPEMTQFLVRMKWEKTLPMDKAIWETGMFAIPIVACKLRNRFTIDRLIERFGLSE